MRFVWSSLLFRCSVHFLGLDDNAQACLLVEWSPGVNTAEDLADFVAKTAEIAVVESSAGVDDDNGVKFGAVGSIVLADDACLLIDEIDGTTAEGEGTKSASVSNSVYTLRLTNKALETCDRR